MNVRQERDAAKRRIMFIAGEDFYFLAYTLFILLSELGATSSGKALVDSRKLAYIADLIGGDSDLRLAVTSASLSTSGRARLALLYDRAVARRVPVERLLEALAKRGLIAVSRSPGQADKIHLLQTEQIKTMLESSHYRAEQDRLKQLRVALPHLRTMTLVTLKKRLFDDKGVRTWGG